MTVTILFYIFALISVIGALLVITASHPVKAVLSLVMTFVAAACTWLLVHAEFLALILIVVYVGAVMVLFLFVVMMLDVDQAKQQRQVVRYWPLALLVAGGITALLIVAVGPHHFGLSQYPQPPAPSAHFSTIKQLGGALYSHYLYPFELAAVILLAAMVSAIALTFRGRRQGTRAQIPARQIAVDPKSRLSVVKMASEPKEGAK